MRIIQHIAIALISIACTSTAVASAVASPEPSPLVADSVVNLDEISVSAIKSLSRYTFPTTVTTLNRSSIERYDVSGLKQLSEIAPNFYMPAYGSRMTSSIYMRGFGTRIDQPVVGLTVDNVPMMSKDAYDFAFPDIERASVVRGPQATLYGRNTMCGVINLSTTSPLQYTGLRASAEYASANSLRLFAGVYTRPSANTGLAFVGAYNSTDGFFRNLYTGNKIDKERQGLGKIKFSWRPSNRFQLENNAWVTVTRQGGYPYESLSTGQISHNDTCYYDRISVNDGLTLRLTGDKVNFSSITSFQYLNDDMTLDQDFTPKDYFTLSQRRHEWSMSQDFVATGHAGRYSWLGGLLGFIRHTDMTAPVTFKDDGISALIEQPMHNATGGTMAIIWDDRFMRLNSDFELPTHGFAFYHKSEYTLGRWRLAGALRLAYERNSIDYHSWCNTAYTLYMASTDPWRPIRHIEADVNLSDRLHETSLQLLPEIKAAYDISDMMSIGAVWSKGYKSGGYNTQMFSDMLQQALMGGNDLPYEVDDIISYQPEVSWNYEINYTARLLDNHLNIDAAMFYIDCRNQQLTVFPPGTTTGRMMTNAGRSRSVGIELAATLRPDDHWRLDASYGLADARFRHYNDGQTDYAGRHVPYAPLNTMFAALTWSAGASPWHWLDDIQVTAGVRGVGKIWWNENNSVTQPFYATLGASVTLRTRLADIVVWGENLTGTRYSTFYFMSVGNRFVQRGTPRRFGITLRFDFSMQ